MKFKKGDKVRLIRKEDALVLDSTLSTTEDLELNKEYEVKGIEEWGGRDTLSIGSCHYNPDCFELVKSKRLSEKGMCEKIAKRYMTIRSTNIVVHTKTQEEYDRLMQILEDKGYKWVIKGKPTELNIWAVHKENTCIRLENKGLGYARKGFYEEHKDEYGEIISFGEYIDRERKKIIHLLNKDFEQEYLTPKGENSLFKQMEENKMELKNINKKNLAEAKKKVEEERMNAEIEYAMNEYREIVNNIDRINRVNDLLRECEESEEVLMKSYNNQKTKCNIREQTIVLLKWSEALALICLGFVIFYPVRRWIER